MKLKLGELVRFSIIGGGATLAYLVIAVALEFMLDISAVSISVLSYVMASIFSFLGHRYFTFNHRGQTKKQIIRFGLSTAIGISIAVLIPVVFHMLSPNILYLLVAISVPIISFVLLKFFVFTGD